MNSAIVSMSVKVCTLHGNFDSFGCIYPVRSYGRSPLRFLFLRIIYIIYLCVHASKRECTCIHEGFHRGQKRALDSLGK